MILDKIIKKKKEEVRDNKINFPLDSFKSFIKKSDRDFKAAIKKKISLIAEIKKLSPSEGSIRKDFNLKTIARTYQRSKAVAISVLTDEKYFGGNIAYLRTVRSLTTKPLLRKDFIIDEYQVYESRFYGADAILLIARILTKNQIQKFIEIAKKYNMDCLVEIHNEKELKKLPNNVEIIGINNRNLDTLKTDLNTTLKIIKLIPKNKIIVTESGYYTNKEIQKVKNKVNAVLIGTSILKEKDINKKINEISK